MLNNLSKICIFDSCKGIEFPSKIDVFPVEHVLGNTVEEVHNNSGKCQLFCAIVNIENENFIVPTEKDKIILESIIKYGKRNDNVSVRESSIWYSKNARKNIIISSNVDIDGSDLSVLLSMYINKIAIEEREKIFTNSNMYIVTSKRSNIEVIRTPSYTEAVEFCDQNPGSVVILKNEIIYKSRFGKVNIPRSRSANSKILKSKFMDKNNNFNIKIEL